MNTKKKTYIFLIGFIVLNLALIALLIYPVFSEIEEISDNLVSQREEMSLLQSKVETLKEFEIEFKNMEPDLNKINALFINTDLPLDFIDFLEETASESGILMEIVSSSFSNKSKVDFWPSISFQMSYIGSLTECSGFLERIETSPYIIRIENLKVRQMSKIESKVEEVPFGDLKVNLILRAYGN